MKLMKWVGSPVKHTQAVERKYKTMGRLWTVGDAKDSFEGRLRNFGVTRPMRVAGYLAG
jgi:hypothetical protein